MTTLQARRKTHDLISPQEYLRRRSSDPRSVEDAVIVVPELGNNGFGSFQVPVKEPVYEVEVVSDLA